MRARRRGWAAVLLAGAAGLGPVLVTALPAEAFTASVKMVPRAGAGNEFDYSPNVITIDVDAKVLWTNKSPVRHTVTSDPGSTAFDSGEIPPDGQWERRFTTAGTYTYHCDHHPNMVGRIEVGAPASTTTSTAPATSTSTAPVTTTAPAPAPAPAPETTATTAPTTTTTTAGRPASGPGPVPAPPVPNSAAAPAPTASSTTTSAPPTTTTAPAPTTTVTSAPPTLAAGDQGAPPPAAGAPPSTSPDKTGDEIPVAAGPPKPGGKLDVGAIAMVAALVAAGAFGAWTLLRVRPGRV